MRYACVRQNVIYLHDVISIWPNHSLNLTSLLLWWNMTLTKHTQRDIFCDRTEPHWDPIHQLCDPCQFQPTHIVKMESFTPDAQAVLHDMGVGVKYSRFKVEDPHIHEQVSQSELCSVLVKTFYSFESQPLLVCVGVYNRCGRNHY